MEFVIYLEKELVMSWTPSMAKEAVVGLGDFILRKKTGRRIKIHFEKEYPIQVVTKALLETGEILEDSRGNQVKILYPELFTEKWAYKVYFAEVIIKNK